MDFAKGFLRASRADFKIRSGSSNRPQPSSPQAKIPEAESKMSIPILRKVSRDFCVTGCEYILVFIAGAIRNGFLKS
ncbi:hypothetical protein D3C72_2194800 [compost metagenome]